MQLPIVDVVLIVLLSGFIFYGLFFGLIRTVGAYLPVSELIEPIFFNYNNLGKVLVFLVLFTLINRLVGFGFYLLEKIFNVISIIPFLKTINRLGGAVLGFLTGGLSIGLLLFVVSRYTLLDSILGRWLVDSKLAPMFLKMNDFLLPLLPVVLKKLQAII
jgi:uncharacterized membrane protein required for colicin V production